MNKKRISILIVLSILLLIAFFSTYSYALFESDISGEAEAEIASWTTKINNTLINLFHIITPILSTIIISYWTVRKNKK